MFVISNIFSFFEFFCTKISFSSQPWIGITTKQFHIMYTQQNIHWIDLILKIWLQSHNFAHTLTPRKNPCTPLARKTKMSDFHTKFSKILDIRARILALPIFFWRDTCTILAGVYKIYRIWTSVQDECKNPSFPLFLPPKVETQPESPNNLTSHQSKSFIWYVWNTKF